MSTDLHHIQTFTAPAADVFAKFADRSFIEGRLASSGGIDPAVSDDSDLDGADGTVTIVTRQNIPASVLPSMVASMMPGDPLIIRTEKWTASGDGRYTADFDVQIKGAPASLKGTMVLADADGDGKGSTLTTDGTANVPIPLFGGKIEGVIVEQVEKLLAAEERYTNEQSG